MILFHRILPFVFVSIVGVSFVLVLLFGFHPLAIFLPALLFCALILGRLIDFDFSHFQNRYFFGLPILFLLSSFGLLLFLESSSAQWALAAVATALSFFYTEHVFHFLHLPAQYQAYTLEHLSLVLSVLSIFFLSTVGFGARLFLNAPLWMLVVIFFVTALFIIFGMLWVSKVEGATAKSYALGGTVLATEIFAVTMYLPSGFYVNACLVAIFFYLFLGLTRAHFLDQLSRVLVRRYLMIASLLLVMILGSANWF